MDSKSVKVEYLGKNPTCLGGHHAFCITYGNFNWFCNENDDLFGMIKEVLWNDKECTVCEFYDRLDKYYDYIKQKTLNDF